ncbi:MAG: alpha/beta fold hydrolase [Burkholderiaceae bacterium]|nr:alpha/beta fold hydrolase [Burkholderiaceae bacterium]
MNCPSLTKHDNEYAQHAHETARAFDQSLHASIARMTSGLSPTSLALAYTDWAMHLAQSPGERSQLLGSALAKSLEVVAHGIPSYFPTTDQTDQTTATAEPDSSDSRFASPDWAMWPYTTWVQGFKASERWWCEATDVPGVAPHNREVVNFFARQWLDMMSPSNWPWSPEVMRATIQTVGRNLQQGSQNWIDDWRESHGLLPLQAEQASFVPGKSVAITPGHVVWRNHLMELIQYTPTTPTVHAEPVLIIPSWIMKYYILDLSPHNSMVRYLVEQGHTVFMVSWRNPDASDAKLGLSDYIRQGIFESLKGVARQCPGQSVQAMGYCLGGTLLSMAVARLIGPHPIADAQEMAPIKTLTLLATEVDFTEPGEMGVFIDPAQVNQLEDLMSQQGYLTGKQMGGSFQFLRSRDLVWSRQMHEYLLGERTQPSDLMAWNADVTRMPAAMHGQYLSRLFLNNELAEGRYTVEGEAVSLQDIRVPMMVVATEKDHVSPWRSVYKIHRLTETQLTFVLTNGGHNAGIISEPGHAHRHYKIHQSEAMDPWLTPDEWTDTATLVDGSWWPAWQRWLAEHSSGQVNARHVPPAQQLGDAPGEYVLVRYQD